MLQKLMQALMPPKMMIDMFTLKIESNLPIDGMAAKVESACTANGMVLLKDYNYHEIVESKGFPIKRKVYIYDICQAKTASLMLTSNPGFSIFMPCTLAMYEENGKTIISTMNMELMFPVVKANKVLHQEATTLFNSFKKMMAQLATGK